MTHTTRRDWVEVAIGSLVVLALSRIFGYAASITMWTLFWVGWLYGRHETRRRIRDALTQETP